jgi:hypothetical protein
MEFVMATKLSEHSSPLPIDLYLEKYERRALNEARILAPDMPAYYALIGYIALSEPREGERWQRAYRMAERLLELVNRDFYEFVLIAFPDTLLATSAHTKLTEYLKNKKMSDEAMQYLGTKY